MTLKCLLNCTLGLPRRGPPEVGGPGQGGGAEAALGELQLPAVEPEEEGGE